MPLRPRTRWALAGVLFAGTVALLSATLEMGYTRDESFYFRFARSYAGWFTRIDDAGTPEEVREAFSEESVIGTWKGNHEHPPLMKSAFAASWRHLARKDRRARVASKEGESPLRLLATGLVPADGFEVGDEALVLAPLRLGVDPADPVRVLGRGVVARRVPREATVHLESGDAGAIREACRARAGEAPAPGEPPLVTGCQLRAPGLLDEATAMRLPGIVSGGLAVSLTFLLGEALLGWLAGLLGALAFLFVPRHFFHAHLTCFDMPIVAAELLVLLLFWRSLSDRRFALGSGVAWGAALLVKLNALFLPARLLLWWLLVSLPKPRLRDVPAAFLVAPLVAVPMLFAFWPWLWYAPFDHLGSYLGFHLHHEHYMQWYFGRPLQVPPFPVEYPFVMTALTVPEGFLLLVLAGAARALVRARAGLGRRETAFLLVNGLFPIVLIALPSTPIFGGVKHWMTGMPLLLLLGADALAAALRLVATTPARTALATALVAVAFAWPVRATLSWVPFGTGHWSSLLGGGAPGGADKELMRLFWGYTSLQSLPWVNENAPPGARIFFQNTTRDAYEMYQRMGLLREDVHYARAPEGADLALIDPKQAFNELDLRTREALRKAGPDRVVSYEGVPYLRVYAQARASEAAGTPPPPPASGRATRDRGSTPRSEAPRPP